MSSRAKKILLLLLATGLLAVSGRVEQSLNLDREQLGLTQVNALQDAPPVLAFTTVALGGFRGLISNFLWIRANDLQQDDKFFEAAQLAKWITDLEPHFTQVWLFQAWNMAYNISVKFKENAPGDYSDRWGWVKRGIELLRDDGLRYNPDNIPIHRELAWFFQHKMGQNLDDGNAYYKEQWAAAMTQFFGPDGTNFSALINPQTPQQRTNAALFREEYKMNPAFAEKVDHEYGPLDWRLPEAHAIYWGAIGLEDAKKDHTKAKADDLITLQRIIYQSMLQAFHHGRIINDPFNKSPELDLEPNLALIPRVNDAYETMMRENPQYHENIANAHRNFLKDAVYFLYENNRIAEAEKWFKLLGKMYPDKNILDGDANSLPRNLTLDEYAVARVQEEVGDTSQERTTGVVEGLLARSYYELAIGQDDRAAGFKLLAQKVWENYMRKISKMKSNVERVGLPPFDVLNRTVLNQLLDPENGMPYAMRAVLRTRLGLPAETAGSFHSGVPPTNAVPAAAANSAGALTNQSAPAARR